MSWPVLADKQSMEMCDTWKCPGCGALVGLPGNAPAPVDASAEKRLDQIAQASCGCWVDTLSDRRMARLLDAIVNVDDMRFSRVLSAHRF
jgi:hypothetical protein